MRTLWRGGICAAAIGFLGACTLRADLPLPGAAELAGPFFVQPFSFVTVGSTGMTSPFFSSLPAGSYPSLQVVNILGNFQAFDSIGSPVTAFGITGVEVATGGATFTPAFGSFNFAAQPSVTFTDALNPLNTATFFPTDFTFAFTFMSDPTLSYSYTLETTGLAAGSTLIFDDAEATVPEPGSIWPLGIALSLLLRASRRPKRA
jgi:hypothetical protein